MSTNLLKKEWYVIVNPNAGSRKGVKDWERISSLFRKEDIPIISRFTESKGHAIEIAKEAVISGFRRIATVGGDGTLNEVLNGVFGQSICPVSEISLGLIPVGTGNDWGRMFGIPLVYVGAVELIRLNRTLAHDVGVVKYFSGGKQYTRYFLNIAGVGFESTVVMKTNKQKEKGRSNNAIYFYNLLSSLISYRNTMVDLTMDDIRTSCKIFSINVGNGRYCGGGMRQTPDALPDDGLLDITVIRSMGRIEIIRNLKILYDGTILSHPKVDGYRTKMLRIESESVLHAEADGELLGHTPVEFSVIPLAVNIVYGKRIIQ